MAFKIEKFGAEVSNAKSILGGISYYRYAMTNNDDITTAGYFPSKLGLKEGDRIWVTPKTKTNADALYIVSSVSDAGVVTVIAAPSDTGQTIQVEELPEASAGELGNIYQFVGTTGDTYTNGYFYKCTGAGEPVVYSWSQVDVQPAPEALPDQSGQSGKFLTTDGTNASWGSVESLPSQTGQSGKFLTTDGTNASWGNALQNKALASSSFSVTDMAANKLYCTVLGTYASAGANAWTVTNATAYGYSANVGESCTCYGASAQAGNAAYNACKYNIAIGAVAKAGTANNVVGAIQIGAPASGATNNDSNTFKVANANGNYEMMSADGTIPAARHASLPAADGTYVLKLTISGGVPTLSWVAE